MTRTEGPCCWCGRATRAIDRVCPECVGIDRRADREPGFEHALRDGQWVTRGLVRVWKPDPPRPGGWAACGTDGGYYRHRRVDKTPPCMLCRAAHSRAKVEREQRRREAVA